MKYLSVEKHHDLPRSKKEFFETNKKRFMGYMSAMIERNKDVDIHDLVNDNAQTIASEYHSINKCLNSVPVFVGEDQAYHHGVSSGYYYELMDYGFETFNEDDRCAFVEMINKERNK